jgi:hypothetical protein
LENRFSEAALKALKTNKANLAGLEIRLGSNEYFSLEKLVEQSLPLLKPTRAELAGFVKLSANSKAGGTKRIRTD